MNNGILELMKERGTVVNYDPTKGATIEEVVKTMIALSEMPQRKPEYLLSKWEAENLPLWQLKWLGENYIVLVGTEISDVIQKRESENQY